MTNLLCFWSNNRGPIVFKYQIQYYRRFYKMYLQTNFKVLKLFANFDLLELREYEQ